MQPSRPRSIHTLLDYAIGVLLLVGPWLFDLTSSFIASSTTIAFGAVVIANAYCMNYRVRGRRLPVPMHMLCDVVCGGLLVAAPWILRFAERSWIPHLVVGAVIAVRGLFFLSVVLLMQSMDDGSMCEARP